MSRRAGGTADALEEDGFGGFGGWGGKVALVTFAEGAAVAAAPPPGTPPAVVLAASDGGFGWSLSKVSHSTRPDAVGCDGAATGPRPGAEVTAVSASSASAAVLGSCCTAGSSGAELNCDKKGDWFAAVASPATGKTLCAVNTAHGSLRVAVGTVAPACCFCCCCNRLDSTPARATMRSTATAIGVADIVLKGVGQAAGAWTQLGRAGGGQRGRRRRARMAVWGSQAQL